MQLSRTLLSLGSKNKNNPPVKKFLSFKKWNFSPQKKLNKTFLNFLAPKIYMKLFYTLDKTPSGETGCLSNVYYLLAFQAS